MQRDPLAVSGPGSQGLNRYAYAGNNPANRGDPGGFSAAVDRSSGEFPDNHCLTTLGELLEAPVVNAACTNAQFRGSVEVLGAVITPVRFGLGNMLGVVLAESTGADDDDAASDMPPIKAGSTGGDTAGKDFPKTVIRKAFEENPKRICVFCRRVGKANSVDHAISKKQGGNALIDNAQLVCPRCNSSKGG